MLLASFRREPWSTITTADVCRTDSETAEPFAGWTAAGAQGLAPEGGDLLLQWYELKGFSGMVAQAHTLQQSDTPGLVAHSAPFPDVPCLCKGPEVNCSVSLAGQCNGARARQGQHFSEGQRPAI